MKAKGFRVTALGLDGPEAWARAQKLNDDWDLIKSGQGLAAKVWPDKSLGWLFEQYRGTNVWETKAPRTREEWELAWKFIAPVFGDVPVASIDFPASDAFYAELGKAYSLHKQHRIFKIFRALLEVAIGFKLISENPTHRIANSAPKGRKQIWYEHEVRVLRAKAREEGYKGLALAIGIAYDTQMQPVDVRLLTLGMRRRDKAGVYFETSREKTGKEIIATLSKETEAELDTYLAELGVVLPADQPFLRNRSGHVYSKDTLGDDFRTIRCLVYPNDDRRLMDLRRTGNVEAVAGGAEPTQLTAKLGNTLAQSNALYDAYTPVQLAVVREADKKRVVGRKRLLKFKPGKKSDGEQK
jgi:hypothetical protein